MDARAVYAASKSGRDVLHIELQSNVGRDGAAGGGTVYLGYKFYEERFCSVHGLEQHEQSKTDQDCSYHTLKPEFRETSEKALTEQGANDRGCA